MVKKKNNKKILICTIVLVSIIILLIKLIQQYKIEKYTYNFPISIKNKNGTNYEYNDVNYQILYNTVMVPMNETFIGIFGEQYTKDTNQEINYNNTKIQINNDENRIILPNIYKRGDYQVNDTIEVEIEYIDGVKYVPVYLISNLPGIIVKIDNKEVYSTKNYLSSIEAINNNNDKHKVVIYTDQKKDKNETIYIGQQDGALWREEALKRIEKYRKNKSIIKVKNQIDLNIYNANISVKMNNNKFKFGNAVNLKTINMTTRNFFNLIVSESSFKWKFLDDFKNADNTYKYATNNSIYIKGHNLWWDYVCVNRLKNLVMSDEDNKVTFEYIYNKYNNNEINLEQANILIEELISEFEDKIYLHIEEMVKRYPEIVEWDVINEPINYQYFKYYLYDKNLLNDNGFLNSTVKQNVKYNNNERYNQFIANCYNLTRENNNTAKLILNDEKIKGYYNTTQVSELIELIKDLKTKTNNINSIGIQAHCNNNYNVTPQSYYNQINYVLEQTGLKDAIISEYDNYQTNKLNTYTSEEKKAKANYLRDMLIMSYSNPNISEFTMWVYYSDHFCDEERQAYEETVYPWLNHTEEGTTTENGYTTRLYKGTYTATITLPNGKTKDIEFTVSDDSSDTVEVVIDSEITDVKIKNKPSKTKYYRNDNIDLTDGIITIYYDDGTTKELKMNDSSISITGFDSSTLGQQTIKLNYEGHEVSFEINVEESKDTLVKNSIISIENSNNDIKAKYNYIINNDTILNKYNDTISVLNELKDNIENIDNSKINDTYKSEYDLALEIIKEYNKRTLDITEEELKNVINDIIDLTSNYMELYKYYFDNDTINSDEVANNLNQIIDKYNNNNDIDLSLEAYYINQMKDIYNNNITGQNSYENYLNKRRILNTTDIISYTLNDKVKKTAYEESNNIKVEYNTDINIPTNKDVTVQIKLPSDKCSIENNPSNTIYTFTENGTQNITINIRGYKYNFSIEINNIDKTPPQITGIEEKGHYNEKVTPQIADENLSGIKLIKDGQVVEGYKANTSITQEGIYQLIAKDTAGNETTINFIISYPEEEKYQIENNTIKNINGGTKISALKEKLQVSQEYKIKRNDKELNETDNISTGDILETTGGEKYTLIVKGDINKDGHVTIKDIVRLRKYLLGNAELGDIEKIAADANLDGKEIGIKDLVRMRILALTREN